MAFDIMPRSFWRLPSIIEDDDDNWSLTPWSPNATGVSISEDEKTVTVGVAVPGLDEKDIEVTFDKGVLWVKGEKKEEEQDKKRKFYRRAASSFSYRVAVPGDLDLSKEPEATYKNGVMTVSFVKSPMAQPKKISVKSSK
jgi:HSP20 family protein